MKCFDLYLPRMHIIEPLIPSQEKAVSILTINLILHLGKENYLFNIHCLHAVSVNEGFGVAIIQPGRCPRLGLGGGPLANVGHHGLREGEAPAQAGWGERARHTVKLQLLLIQLKQ